MKDPLVTPKRLNDSKRVGPDGRKDAPQLPDSLRGQPEVGSGLAKPPIDMGRRGDDRDWRDAYRPPPSRLQRGEIDRGPAAPRVIPNPPTGKGLQRQDLPQPRLEHPSGNSQPGDIRSTLPGSVRQSVPGNTGVRRESGKPETKGGGNRGRSPKGE